MVTVPAAALQLELPLEGLVDHELDADVREHCDQSGQQAGVQALEAAADLEDSLHCLADAAGLVGVGSEDGLDDLEGVDDGRRHHARHAARE